MSKVCFHLFIFELLSERLHTSASRFLPPLPLPCTAYAACLSCAAKNHHVFVASYLHSLCLLVSHLCALSVLSLPVYMVANEDKVLIHALLHGIIYAEKHCHQYWVCFFLCILCSTKIKRPDISYIPLRQ